MVAVFREVRRVLAPHGTLWLNMGDSYNGSGGDHKEHHQRNKPTTQHEAGSMAKKTSGLKPKDLCGIPWRLALALQADGWWLRQDIIWSKPNPMPESVTDRCTKAHEYLFLLTKKAKYYFDNEAIKEPSEYPDDDRKGRAGMYHRKPDGSMNYVREGSATFPTRNKRSVWTIPTQSCPDAHFATFPEKLVEPCILAGCPKEVCNKCGKPRERIVDVQYQNVGAGTVGGRGRFGVNDNSGFTGKPNMSKNCTTTGWTDCGCGDYRTGIVLDCFGGSGTTGRVAARLGRDYVLIELNPEYIKDIAEAGLRAVETGVSVAEQKQGQMALFEGAEQ